MTHNDSPASLAQLDQEIAGLDACVDRLVDVAEMLLADMGHTQAVPAMTVALAVASAPDKNTVIAATALVRLAERRRRG